MTSWGARLRKPFGLRLRLTLSFSFLFTVLLLGLGLLSRQVLETTIRTAIEDTLEEESGAVRGYLRISHHKPVWHVDQDDEEERFAYQRMHRIFFLADRAGQVLESSETYSYIGEESRDQAREILTTLLQDKLRRPVWKQRKDEDGVTYLLRYGVLVDDNKQDFLLVLGRSLDQSNYEKILNQFTASYYTWVPILIIGLSALGWFLAGRALNPLNAVALAAQSLTGRTLNLRISRRGAEDELDHLIDKFNNMVDRLENSFNQIRRFSMDVSHELRTPLTAIRGELEVALLSANTAAQYREAMVSAIEEVDRLGQIVRGLLHLSQAETGQVALTKAKLDLAEVTAKMVEQYGMAAEMDQKRMTFDAEPNCLILGDRIQIERLVGNLLSNAVKYTEAGGSIAVEVKRTASGVDLVIRDTGKGISEEHLPHIFERFYRVPDGNIDPERGMGLGLSFVAWIAQAHDAEIAVDSHPGKGTCFTVRFPDVTQPSIFRPAAEAAMQEK